MATLWSPLFAIAKLRPCRVAIFCPLSSMIARWTAAEVQILTHYLLNIGMATLTLIFEGVVIIFLLCLFVASVIHPSSHTPRLSLAGSPPRRKIVVHPPPPLSYRFRLRYRRVHNNFEVDGSSCVDAPSLSSSLRRGLFRSFWHG